MSISMRYFDKGRTIQSTRDPAANVLSRSQAVACEKTRIRGARTKPPSLRELGQYMQHMASMAFEKLFGPQSGPSLGHGHACFSSTEQVGTRYMLTIIESANIQAWRHSVHRQREWCAVKPYALSYSTISSELALKHSRFAVSAHPLGQGGKRKLASGACCTLWELV